MKRIRIPAKSAVAVEVTRGKVFRVVNSEGGQVVDTWAFNSNDISEYLSMSHSRTVTYHLMFRQNDCLVSNQFNPILTIIKDTSPGMHDTLHAACSAGSYAHFGERTNHPNCQDNLRRCMQSRGSELRFIPDPWNLFEHTCLDKELALSDKPSAAKTGDYIELRAEMDLVIVCSACPSRIGNISGDASKGAEVCFPE